MIISDTVVLFGAALLATPFQTRTVALLGILPVLLTSSVFGLYNPRNLLGWGSVARSVLAWGLLLVVAAVVAFPVTGLILTSLALWITVGLLGTELMRTFLIRPWLARRYGRSIRGARVIVGTGMLARKMAGAASEIELEPALVGFVDDVEDTAHRAGTQKTLPAPFLGGLDAVRELAMEGRISHVLVAREDLSRARLVDLAHSWMTENLQVSLVSSAFEVMVARASASMLGGVPLANLQTSPQRGWKLRWKRGLDLAISIGGGILLLPILCLIALAIKMTSDGPVFYKQPRVGRNGREFTFYKFRSMHSDSDDRAHRSYVEALMRGEPAGVNVHGEKVYKLVDDPRVTRVGRFLRATSFDEFPQLWNVIKGDMSLVGPRPCLPYEWELYEDWQRPRLAVLPGITGLWQVSGRSQVPFEEMVLLDLHYNAHWSLGLDLSLLLKTVPVVLNGSGGH